MSLRSKMAQQEQDTSYLHSYDSSYTADYYNSAEYDGYQGETEAGYESPDPDQYNTNSYQDDSQFYTNNQAAYQTDSQYSDNMGGFGTYGNEETYYQYDPATQSYTGYDEEYQTDGEASAYAGVYGADQVYEGPDEDHNLAATDGYTATEEGVDDVLKEPQTTEAKEEKTEEDAGAEGATKQERPEEAPNKAATADPNQETGDEIPTDGKKKRTGADRVKKRQEVLEKEKEKKTLATEAEASTAASRTSGSVIVPNEVAVGNTQGGGSRPPVGFIEREKAKINLQIKKAKAIAKRRVPVQVRVLTDTRKILSPLEKYFGGSVNPVLSDIYWSSMKGDIHRVKHLVEIEGVDTKDSQFDPWNLHQTPLHWAAKGGAADVAEYLLKAGASARSLDDNGSTPLHLACWGGHVDVTLMILRFVDNTDLYVRDWDAGLAPLDWANIRGHTTLLAAIGKFEDSIWLPKFVEDLIRGIIKYQIKVYKAPLAQQKQPLPIRQQLPRILLQ